MTELGADFGELESFSKRFIRFLPRWHRYHEVTMEEMAEELLLLVRQQASGRPGPNVISGRYLGSIRRNNLRVFTDHPAGPRLEFGFTGADRLGRVYHQQPFPHWRPAAVRMRRMFPRQIKRTVVQVWRDK